MSPAEPPSVHPRIASRPGDDLDGLLRDFFRAAMPTPWPALTPPAAVRRTEGPVGVRRLVHNSSRLALAASMGLLLLGSGLLAGKFRLEESVRLAPAGAIASPRFNKDVILKESIELKYELVPGPDGRPIRQDKGTSIKIDVYEGQGKPE